MLPALCVDWAGRMPTPQELIGSSLKLLRIEETFDLWSELKPKPSQW